jgi:hypothetical protein
VIHLYAPDSKNLNGNISYHVDVHPGEKTNKGAAIGLPHYGGLQPGDDYADAAHNAYVAVNSFDKSARTATVTVGTAKLEPKLTYTGGFHGQTGKQIMLAARLTVDGAPVPNQPVQLKLDGHPCPLPAGTDPNGVARCNVTDTVSAAQAVLGVPITAFFSGDSVFKSVKTHARFGGGLGVVKTPVPVTVPASTGPSTGTVVVVKASVPMEYAFRLSTAGEKPVVSDGAKKLILPEGNVTFQVTNAASSILSHDFEVCSSNTGGKKNRCTGASTPVLAPGASATITVDFTSPGTYEYLSSVASDAFSGMKGELEVT